MLGTIISESMLPISFTIPPHLYEDIHRALQPEPLHMRLLWSFIMPLASVLVAGTITYYTAKLIMGKKAAIEYKLHVAKNASTLIRELFEFMDMLSDYYVEYRNFRTITQFNAREEKREKLQESSFLLVKQMSKIYVTLVEVRMTSHKTWQEIDHCLDELKVFVTNRKTYIDDNMQIEEVDKIIKEFHDSAEQLIIITDFIEMKMREYVSAGYSPKEIASK